MALPPVFPNSNSPIWTKEEDNFLMNTVEKRGRQWKLISDRVGKSPIECLKRYDTLIIESFEKRRQLIAPVKLDQNEKRPTEVEFYQALASSQLSNYQSYFSEEN